MIKNEFETNIRQALESYDCGLNNKEIQLIVELAYDPKQTWYYDDFDSLAREINSECGDIVYALEQFDLVPYLYDNESYTRDWIAEHKKVIPSILEYAEIKSDDEYAIMGVDIDTIEDWFKELENEKLYYDCLIYIKNRKKGLDK